LGVDKIMHICNSVCRLPLVLAEGDGTGDSEMNNKRGKEMQMKKICTIINCYAEN
jgi:hypothetical protein